MEQISMIEAINTAFEGMRRNGCGPFGTIVIKNGEIVG